MGKAPIRGQHSKRKIIKKSDRYISRNGAAHKLQVSPKTFRWLCIMKGIYPVARMNKKGRLSSTRWYHLKDIRHLMFDPLLQTSRDLRAFLKKYKKLHNRGEPQLARSLAKELKPQINYDHLVRERYPTFTACLRDLDDCLTMCHTFANFPVNKGIEHTIVHDCQKLVREFQMYIAATRSLRKTFVTIKGVYYQAEIHGETVTWICPHNFPQDVPISIDISVMRHFLDFYVRVLAFVNFKLYHTVGIVYPPPVVWQRNDGTGIASIKMKRAVDGTPIFDWTTPKKFNNQNNKQQNKATPPLASISTDSRKINSSRSNTHNDSDASEDEDDDDYVQEDDDEDDDEEEMAEEDSDDDNDEDSIDDSGDDEEVDEAATETSILPHSTPMPQLQTKDESNAKTVESAFLAESANGTENKELERFKKLFEGLVFFINRECMISSLQFVIMCFGGVVGWDSPQSPIKQDSPSITHHIIDRPNFSPDARFAKSREHIQPQWIFDSVNARVRLPVQLYAIGVRLPPHLSPFVDYEKKSYVPEFYKYMQDLRERQIETDNVDDGGAITTLDQEEDSDDEAEYARDLEAETRGVLYSTVKRKSEAKKEKTGKSFEDVQRAAREQKRKTRQEQEEKEMREMALQVMNSKKRKLYQRMQRHEQYIERQAEDLTRRRERKERRDVIEQNVAKKRKLSASEE